ncbi:hypothetical protein FXB38_09310 [Bradyrhizobium cytisi]|uniref:Uncharacterized protein n=1 Tax=Bradyrhizobium cytisi TaxID=515489 RepID=A0A5S4X8D6_9BRAD|nr:hypothetical protein FXB38_09310 [Bradyrhizobium cytisi]
MVAIMPERPESIHPSLRAQRSNPDCLRGKILDCFAPLAMTEDADLPRVQSPPHLQKLPPSCCRRDRSDRLQHLIRIPLEK